MSGMPPLLKSLFFAVFDLCDQFSKTGEDGDGETSDPERFRELGLAMLRSSEATIWVQKNLTSPDSKLYSDRSFRFIRAVVSDFIIIYLIARSFLSACPFLSLIMAFLN